jgi:hypothetical protein
VLKDTRFLKPTVPTDIAFAVAGGKQETKKGGDTMAEANQSF